jgi:hypothetical protein
MRVAALLPVLLSGSMSTAKASSRLAPDLPLLGSGDAAQLLDVDVEPKRFHLLSSEPLRDVWGVVISRRGAYFMLVEAAMLSEALGRFIEAVNEERALRRNAFLQITIAKQRVERVAACLVTFHLADETWPARATGMIRNTFGRTPYHLLKDRCLFIVGEELWSTSREAPGLLNTILQPLAIQYSQRSSVLF